MYIHTYVRTYLPTYLRKVLLLPGAAPTCFAVESTIESGCWWLVCASFVHMCTGYAIMHAAKTAVEELELGRASGTAANSSHSSGVVLLL